jgi:hypothetical protein|tara:strand:+ start:601 stop:786 length:186 start_codon:yes stop_codon:yes gene_type:complete
MSKNIWQRERNNIFRSLVKQYVEEGYEEKEAKKLAKEETTEIMEDKEDFIENIWEESFDQE